MAELTTEQMLEKIKEQVHFRTRYRAIETLIDKPIDDEMTAAIYDAVDDINLFPPATKYSLEDIYYNTDTRWKRLMYLAASSNAIQMLKFDWTAHGIDANIEDLSLPSKLPDYDSLLSQLDDKIEKQLERLKKTTKRSKDIYFKTDHASATRGVVGRSLSNRFCNYAASGIVLGRSS